MSEVDPTAPGAEEAQPALVSEATPADGEGAAEDTAREAQDAADEVEAHASAPDEGEPHDEGESFAAGSDSTDEGEPSDQAEPHEEPVEAAAEASPGEEPEPSPQDTLEEEAADTTETPISEEHPIPRHFTAPALISLDRVDDDDTFRVRDVAELADVAALATDIARLGQLFPVDVRLKPPDRFQVITGFRRVAALRFLHRDKVLARLHTDLSDHDAMLMALAAAIHGKQVGAAALEKLRAALESEGRLTPAARDMLEKALSGGDDLAPEEAEEEVDADELAADATLRLGQLNQDLSLLADVFKDLDPERREELLTQLRYSVDLVAFLESLS